MLTNIKISTRLYLLVLAMSLVLIAIGFIGWYNINFLGKGLVEVYNGGVISIQELNTMSDAYNLDIIDAAHDVQEGSISWEEALGKVNEGKQKIQDAWKRYKETNLNDEETKAMSSVSSHIQSSLPIISALQVLISQKDKDQLSKFVSEQLHPTVTKIDKHISKLIKEHIIDTMNDYNQVVKIDKQASIWIIVSTLLGILLGVLIAGLIIKSITIPLEMEVKALKGSTEEIVSSVTQASSSTAETAAAVTETTTTIEELRQTAHISADKAQDVLISAEETLQIVKESKVSLSATIEDMHQIQEKMGIISESISTLSEHSLSIREIMDFVNDLAEQSHLLAVNASIIAAEAGEQGKGFGVIAQEIRVLAEQSKSATVQVRGFLNDIQSATNAAVIATEQGSGAVKKGVDQSVQTTNAVQSLSTSISKVAQDAKQIALTSQQQHVGIDQVKIAMTNINEASKDHVAHMQQIKSAVIALDNVGGALKHLGSGNNYQPRAL